MIYWYSLLYALILSFSVTDTVEHKDLFLISEGTVSFASDAPLEVIKASSTQIKGAIDPASHKFAFSVGVNTFLGFNSPLQKDHFNENFMESKLHPLATFTGKIIEKIDLSKDGEYTVRAKGKLNVHGVKRERIIKSVVTIKDGKLYVKSFFSVLLKEHNITIPRVVYQKISKEILVSVDVVFDRKQRI